MFKNLWKRIYSVIGIALSVYVNIRNLMKNKNQDNFVKNIFEIIVNALLFVLDMAKFSLQSCFRNKKKNLYFEGKEYLQKIEEKTKLIEKLIKSRDNECISIALKIENQEKNYRESLEKVLKMKEQNEENNKINNIK